MGELLAVPNSEGAQRRFDTVPPIKTANAEVGIDVSRGQVMRWEVMNPHTGKFVPVLYQGSEPKRAGDPFLWPNYDASGGQLDGAHGEVPDHGYARNPEKARWHRVEQPDPKKVVMELTYKDLSPDARAAYPDTFGVTVEITADDEGSLIQTTTVRYLDEEKDGDENDGAKFVRHAMGKHAYFAIDHDRKKLMTTEGIPGFDASIIDWNNDPPDTEYDFSGKAVLHMPDRTITIEEVGEDGKPLGPNDEHSVEKIVAWSQKHQNPENDPTKPTDKPDFHFVAFESVTRGKNALKENPIIVKKDHPWTMRTKYSVKFHPPQDQTAA